MGVHDAAVVDLLSGRNTLTPALGGANTKLLNMNNLLGIARAAWAGVTAVTRRAVAAVDAYAAQETGIIKAGDAIRLHITENWQQATEALELFAASQQSTTRFGDDVTRAVFTELATATDGLTLSMERLVEGTALAQDIMERTGRGSRRTVGILAEVYAGNFERLKQLMPGQREYLEQVERLGSASDRTAIAIDLLNEAYGGSAQNISEADQAASEFRNTLGDIKELVGGFLVSLNDLDDALIDVEKAFSIQNRVVVAAGQRQAELGEEMRRLARFNTMLGGTEENLILLTADLEAEIRELDAGIAEITPSIEGMNDVADDGATALSELGGQADITAGQFVRAKLAVLGFGDAILSGLLQTADLIGGPEPERQVSGGGGPTESEELLERLDAQLDRQRQFNQIFGTLEAERLAVLQANKDARILLLEEELAHQEEVDRKKLESHEAEMAMAQEKKLAIQEFQDAQSAATNAALGDVGRIAGIVKRGTIGLATGQVEKAEMAFMWELAEVAASIATFDPFGVLSHSFAAAQYKAAANRARRSGGSGKGSSGGGGGGGGGSGAARQTGRATAAPIRSQDQGGPMVINLYGNDRDGWRQARQLGQGLNRQGRLNNGFRFNESLLPQSDFL